jgi:hypothetical protein
LKGGKELVVEIKQRTLVIEKKQLNVDKQVE